MRALSTPSYHRCAKSILATTKFPSTNKPPKLTLRLKKFKRTWIFDFGFGY